MEKYDEIVSRAKAAYGTGAYDDATIEFLVPDVKESEDERIRKEIIKYLWDISNQTPLVQESLDCRKWIAWLKKQKDYILVPKSHLDPVGKDGEDGMKILEKQKEQKEIPLMNGDAELYFDNWLQMNAGVTRRQCFEEGIRYAEKQKATNSEKPKEWSDEDENMLLSIINAFRNGTVSTIGQEQWLKSLHERFNPQPKQEWSEEDEEMKKLAIDWLSLFHGRSNTNEAKKCIQECIDWLKSLRPQPKRDGGDDYNKGYIKGRADTLKEFNDMPSWKPSEEQMEALDVAFKMFPKDAPYRQRLESLYEQLKKLGVKEEPEYYQNFVPDC